MSTNFELLIEHRLKLLAMKAALIRELTGRSSYTSWLDHDIERTNKFIEAALSVPEKLELKIAKLRTVQITLITWLHRELGTDNCTELLNLLTEDFKDD